MSDENPKHKLVTDEEWKKLRSELLGNWKVRPVWCCMKLEQYLSTVSLASNDKIAIVMNYLRGTGFRTGKIQHPCIAKLRTQLSVEIKKRKAKNEWN